MEVSNLSPSSRYLLKIAGLQENKDQPARCQDVAQDSLLGIAGLASAGTEVFWIPVSLSQGSDGVQYLLAEGMFVSMVLVKFVCYRDLIGEAFATTSKEEAKALGLNSSRVGTTVRLSSSLVISLITEFPLAWQVANDSGSLWKGAIGGYGDTPVSWFSIDHELRALASFNGFGRPTWQLNRVRKQILGELEQTLQECNSGEIDPKWLLAQLDSLNPKDLEKLLALTCCPFTHEESRWTTAGRCVMDSIGAALTASHLWMMGGLAKNGVENFTGSEALGYAGGVTSAVLGLGIAVESIGTAPRNFYDAAIGWWRGERPLFPHFDKVRTQLTILALWHSAFAIASALDGADQTTEGTANDIQRPATAIGLSLMSYWSWMYVINAGLRKGARHAPDSSTRELNSAIERLEETKRVVSSMSDKRFAQFVLDFTKERRGALLAKTGAQEETRLSRNDLERIAGYGQQLDLDLDEL